ncbi:recombinase family protein [Clostridium felsineum]|uniref:recombinase family protein n=1 Tax=Clostridium felsineum TaxID=36839 RepID=UPI00214DEBCC|nr:recombinase family protein [Clostridium felsineum]MCR3760366.1 recombinase family protein [Clostridium felsineum]
MKKIAIYARRSEEKETGESIPSQLRLCRQYAENKYSDVSIDEYFDDDYSGRNMNRPQFAKMMKLIKSNYYSALVFWKLDRVARNTLELLSLHKQLDKLGVTLISITEGFDPSTAAGKLMMTMLAAVAEMERKNISQRVSTNMNELAKQGKWNGGIVPYGYKVINNYLCEDKKNIQIVKEIFSKYFETQSLFSVSNWLKANYNISKQATSIKRILTNLVYVSADNEINRFLNSKGVTIYGELNGNGLISYGKANKTKDEGVEYRDVSEWIISVGKHTPIISGTQYAKIQKILEGNSNSGRRGTGNITFLNGLCRCAFCDSYMRTKQKKGGYKYFVCGKKDSMRNNCNNKSIRIQYVEKIVLNKLENLNIENLNIDFHYNDTNDLKKELNKKKEQIKNLTKKISLASDLEDIFLDQIREFKKEVVNLELLISEKEKDNLLLDVSKFNIDNYIKELKDFKKTFNSYKSIEKKRNLLKKLVKGIYIDGLNKEIRLELNF